MKPFNDLTYIAIALLLIVVLIKVKNGDRVPWFHHSEPPAIESANTQKMNEPPLTPVTDAAERAREINPWRFNFAKLVHRGQRVDSRLMQRVLLSSGYSELVMHLADTHKSVTAGAFEAQLHEFVQQRPQSLYLSNYQLACNDDLCMGYFESHNKEQLQQFMNDFGRGPEVSAPEQGFWFRMPADNSERGLFGYRIAFNASR